MTDSATYPDLKDAPILITGGAQGIGAALVEAFARQGAKVVFLDREKTAGTRLQQQLVDDGHAVEFMAVDLTDETAVVDAMATFRTAHGAPYALINNAAFDPRHDLVDMTMDQWEQLFRLNVGHYFLTCREMLPSMIARGSGSIIMTSSSNFWLGGDRLACYNATKAAAIGFVRSLATEVGRHRIRVNAVAPGWVMTERQMRDLCNEDDRQWLMEKGQVLPDLLRPEDMAPTYLFLASNASKAITRQTILVDAGLAKG